NEDGSSIAFNPEFLERKGYDKLNDLSVLIPRNNPDKWKKISMTAGSKTSSAFDEEDNKATTAPGSIEATKDNISWSGKKGDLIVGYHIYDSNKDKRIGHTTDTNNKTPNDDEEDVIRAVSYFS